MGLSFRIEGAESSPAALRLDRVDSRWVLRQARQALFHYQHQCPSGPAPAGVVLAGCGAGRVVFDSPVLLPDEHYVPVGLLQPSGGRSRAPRLRMPRL